ncbi:hypothetical protein [Sebaldella sp. S0638]|uniref:hypothetical protein n=1 Tax=Sebaldella sp. S0638 TaxID=2957809 RepID=UPI0020A1EDF4|nr:hypothetical protein [Sebaldella sp. S0638]MCP1225463.1 hypothetical protein [Sebaldella sp. S0638]
MKKLTGILIAVFLIIVNLAYLKINTHDFTVKRLIVMNFGILISDLAFWIFLYLNLKKKNFIIFFFIIFLILIDSDRMNVQIFLGYNDRVTDGILFPTVLGAIRLAYLFVSVYFFFFLSDFKNFLLRIAGILNIIVAILVFIEFDNSFAPYLKIITAIVYIFYIFFFLGKIKEDKQEKKEEENESSAEKSNTAT